MAHVHTQVIQIEVSVLVKGDHDYCEEVDVVDSAVVAQLEEVAKELLGSGVVVEATVK